MRGVSEPPGSEVVYIIVNEIIIQWNPALRTPLRSGHIDYATLFEVPTNGSIF